MVYFCCVPFCKNRRVAGSDLSFHRIPENDSLKEEWLKAIQFNILRSPGSRKRQSLGKYTRVCGAHFLETDYWQAGSLKQLRKGTVPSIFSWNKENVSSTEEQQELSTTSTRTETVDNDNILQEKSLENVVLTEVNEVQKWRERNKRLSAQVEILQSENNYLTKRNEWLQRNIKRKAVFSVEDFAESDTKVLHYTGIPTYAIFCGLFKFLLPSGNVDDLKLYAQSPSKHNFHPTCLSAKDQLFLTLMKMRMGIGHEMLSDMFDISISTVSIIFKCWLNLMYLRLGSLNWWPSRDVIIANAPPGFAQKYPNVVGSIDCTEFFINKSSSLLIQSQCYSNYKSNTTMKALVMIDPNGAVIYTSPLFSGAISDKEIVNKSGFLKLLRHKVETGELLRGDTILADKGFNISKQFEEIDLNLNIPTFRVSGKQFTSEEINHIRKIAHERIHVERMIGRLKNFKILSHDIPASLFGSINQIYMVCCMLTNFRYPLRQILPDNSE